MKHANLTDGTSESDIELQITLMYHRVRIGNKLCKNTNNNVDILQNTFFTCKEYNDKLATKSKKLD